MPPMGVLRKGLDPTGVTCARGYLRKGLDPMVNLGNANTDSLKRFQFLTVPEPNQFPEQEERADSPVPSCVSMKSDWSMCRPVTFKDGHPSREERQHQERSKVTSAQSVQQHQTELIKRAEENAHAFLDNELKKLWRGLFSDYPQCSESEREKDGKKEELRRRAIEGVADIKKLCLMEMNQEELANTLWAGKRLLF
ncbi:hypothetical protein N1851_014416 [Merluccius polli]|uniref:Uncharacterized protein n=1 Tax=Merluccius polli TaxID=89951 RepID=A0AA47MUA7_MERPO|nr:hypothetical protein N1851_014416 [Merluccius polli]